MNKWHIQFHKHIMYIYAAIILLYIISIPWSAPGLRQPKVCLMFKYIISSRGVMYICADAIAITVCCRCQSAWSDGKHLILLGQFLHLLAEKKHTWYLQGWKYFHYLRSYMAQHKYFLTTCTSTGRWLWLAAQYIIAISCLGITGFVR